MSKGHGTNGDAPHGLTRRQWLSRAGGIAAGAGTGLGTFLGGISPRAALAQGQSRAVPYLAPGTLGRPLLERRGEVVGILELALHVVGSQHLLVDRNGCDGDL